MKRVTEYLKVAFDENKSDYLEEDFLDFYNSFTNLDKIEEVFDTLTEEEFHCILYGSFDSVESMLKKFKQTVRTEIEHFIDAVASELIERFDSEFVENYNSFIPVTKEEFDSLVADKTLYDISRSEDLNDITYNDFYNNGNVVFYSYTNNVSCETSYFKKSV